MNCYKNIQTLYKHVLQVYLSYNTYAKYKNVTVRFLRKVYFEVGEPERRECQYVVPSILAILKL